jgi:hypothetical protein
MLSYAAPLTLRESLRHKERIIKGVFRHDYAALASSGRIGQNAKVVP